MSDNTSDQSSIPAVKVVAKPTPAPAANGFKVVPANLATVPKCIWGDFIDRRCIHCHSNLQAEVNLKQRNQNWETKEDLGPNLNYTRLYAKCPAGCRGWYQWLETDNDFNQRRKFGIPTPVPDYYETKHIPYGY